MTVPPNVALAAVERLEEIEAKALLTYDALASCLRIAKHALLPNGDHEEALTQIRDLVLAKQKLLDDTNRAIFRKPSFALDLEDDEALALADTFGFHHLKPEQQLRTISARKRRSARESKDLASHGKAMLALVDAEQKITNPHPHSDPSTGA